MGAGTAWAQSDYSALYTSNVTLSTTGGTNASSCKVKIGETSYDGIKAGTGSVSGAVKITVPSGTKYLHMHIASWNNETVTLAVSPTGYSDDISLISNSGISGNSPFTFSGDPTSSDYYKIFTFSSALTADTELTFTASSGRRFVVWGVNSEESSASVFAPTFFPAAGAVEAGTEVTISSATEGATIYYTTDGSTPTTSSTQGTSVTINEATTIKAFAVKEGLNNSAVSTATYTIKEFVHGYAVDFENELEDYYDWTFENVVRSEATTNTFPHGGTYFGRNGSNKANMTFKTKEKVAYPATFTCYVSRNTTNTTASSWKIQVSSDGSTWTDVATQDATEMNVGTWIEFSANLMEYNNVYVRLYYNNSSAVRTVDDIVLTTYEPTELVAPVITVPETFEGSTIATITCTTQGATIYYSFDNSTWTEYTDALTITETTTIYAKAVVGSDESAVVSKTTTKQLVTPTVTIDATGITNTNVYEGTAAGSLAATVTYNAAAVVGATVTWSGNNDEVATIDELTGAVTLVAAGKVAFTATFAANADYNEATATYELTVTNNDPNGPGTVNNPYTVAQAKANTPSTGTSANVYIKGVVSAFFKANIMSDGSNFRYYISDDGTTDNQLIVYKGKGLNNESFTSADDLQIGDEVVICGGLTIYNNAPEVAANNYIVSLIRPVIPSITVDPDLVDVDADEHDGTLGLAYANLTITKMEDFGIQYYDAEGEETNKPDWIEVTVAEQDPEVGEGYVVSYYMLENKDDARTAYFKVWAMDDETNLVPSNLVTITQAEYVAPEETIGSFVKVTSTDDITSGQYLIVYEDGSVAFDGSLTTLDAAENTIGVTIENGKIAATTTNAKSVFNIDVTAGTLQSASGLYIGVSSNSNGLKQTDKAETYTHTFSIDEGENAVIAASFEGSDITLRYNKASDNLRFRYYKSGQQPIQLYKFVADADDVEVTVSAAGYATYCSTSDLDFSATGLTAYKATVTGNEVKFTEVKQVPAGQGVLLKGTEGTYSVPVVANAAALTGNAFIGVTEVTPDVPAGIFVLMNPVGGQGVGFYKTTKAFTVGANTAYLPALAESARSFIGLGDATGIDGIAAEKASNGEIYNLQGQRVTKAQKGLYIVNGRLQVVK